MNKMELIAEVALAAALSKSDAARAIEGFINVLTNALKKGEEVRVVGLGTFGVTVRKAGIGRNPRTGEEIKVAKKRRVRFKSGKQLADAVKDSGK